MSVADIIAIAANLAFLSFIFILLVGRIIKNKIALLIVLSIFGGFVLFAGCYHGITIIDLMRGVIGDLSISGLLFLLSLAIVYFTGIQIDLFDRTFCMIVVFMGLLLYLSAIDIIPVDVYRIGYMPRSFLVIIFLLCMIFLLVNYVFAIIWLVALMIFLAGLQNSVNLWDYLIDPVLWIICTYKFIFSRKL